MKPFDRQSLATAFVVAGALLIAIRLASLAFQGEAQAKGDDELALPVRPARVAEPRPSVLRLERLQARQFAEEAGGAGSLFAPEVAVPVARPAAPAPVRAEEPAPLPPFPYTYLGGMTEDGHRTAFFGSGDRVLALRAGDAVDGQFRVDRLDENQMTVTYLPLEKPMSVPLGASR